MIKLPKDFVELAKDLDVTSVNFEASTYGKDTGKYNAKTIKRSGEVSLDKVDRLVMYAPRILVEAEIEDGVNNLFVGEKSYMTLINKMRKSGYSRDASESDRIYKKGDYGWRIVKRKN